MIVLGLSTHAHFIRNVKFLYEIHALLGVLLSVSPIGLPSRVRRFKRTFTHLFGLKAVALAVALPWARPFLFTNGAAR
jgi:hypothetical protein